MQIVLDIETIPVHRATWLSLIQREAATTPEALAEEQAAHEKASFHGAFLQIVCIGALFLPERATPFAKVWYGNDEKMLLTTFWETLRTETPTGSVRYITHNGFNFDFPALHQRSIIHHVKPSRFPSMVRFRSDAIYDTMEMWALWNTQARIKLDTLAAVLQVPRKSGHGSSVQAQWDAGAHREIADYCLQDVVVTYHCACRMQSQAALSLDEPIQQALHVPCYFPPPPL